MHHFRHELPVHRLIPRRNSLLLVSPPLAPLPRPNLPIQPRRAPMQRTPDLQRHRLFALRASSYAPVFLRTIARCTITTRREYYKLRIVQRTLARAEDVRES